MPRYLLASDKSLAVHNLLQKFFIIWPVDMNGVQVAFCHQTHYLLIIIILFFFYHQIDIFSSEHRSTALMYLTHENLNSVNSLNVFHPSVNMLAGGNSSGKVYLWTE